VRHRHVVGPLVSSYIRARNLEGRKQMPKFVTRVELHKQKNGPAISATQYEELHQVMESHFFHRQIKASDGIVFHLPPAEYYFHAVPGTTAVEIREIATEAVRTLGIRFSLIVFQYTSAAWIGLKRVPDEEREL
jgi:hypothetical protein